MLDIVGSVIIGDGTSTEVYHLNPKNFPSRHLCNRGYIWMPSVVKRVFLLPGFLLQVDGHHQSWTIQSHFLWAILSQWTRWVVRELLLLVSDSNGTLTWLLLVHSRECCFTWPHVALIWSLPLDHLPFTGKFRFLFLLPCFFITGREWLQRLKTNQRASGSTPLHRFFSAKFDRRSVLLITNGSFTQLWSLRELSEFL